MKKMVRNKLLLNFFFITLVVIFVIPLHKSIALDLGNEFNLSSDAGFSGAAQNTDLDPNLQLFGPGIELDFDNPSNITPTPSSVSRTFNRLFTFMMGLVGISAFVMITLGGIQYAGAMGNPSAVQAAKDKIWGAILGLILAAFSVLILQTINPDLVKFKISTKPPCTGGVTTDCEGRVAGRGE